MVIKGPCGMGDLCPDSAGGHTTYTWDKITWAKQAQVQLKLGKCEQAGGSSMPVCEALCSGFLRCNY